jgi:hypothetical protein
MNVCRSCGHALHIDPFNGMHRCTNAKCAREGVYVTREELDIAASLGLAVGE